MERREGGREGGSSFWRDEERDAKKTGPPAWIMDARRIEFPFSLRRERGIEGRRTHGTERGLWTRNETMI
jgi:hypothetical protein